MSEEKYNIDEYPIEEELEEVMKLNKEQVKIIEDLQQKVEQLEKENIKQKEIIENLTTMTVCGDKKQIKNTAQYKLEQLEKENKELKQPQVFIDCEDMEERYGRDLYEDYLKEKIEQLENIRKEAIKATKDVKQFVYDELVDRNVSGATETQCKIMDLLNILNKGDNNGK